MSGRYALVVTLWVRPGQEAAFDAFERKAARIMARHKGRIDSAVRVVPPEGADKVVNHPYEIHIVSFPDKAAHEAYSSDSETVALREERLKIISRTVVIPGAIAGPY